MFGNIKDTIKNKILSRNGTTSPPLWRGTGLWSGDENILSVELESKREIKDDTSELRTNEVFRILTQSLFGGRYFESVNDINQVIGPKIMEIINPPFQFCYFKEIPIVFNSQNDRLCSSCRVIPRTEGGFILDISLEYFIEDTRQFVISDVKVNRLRLKNTNGASYSLRFLVASSREDQQQQQQQQFDDTIWTCTSAWDQFEQIASPIELHTEDQLYIYQHGQPDQKLATRLFVKSLTNTNEYQFDHISIPWLVYVARLTEYLLHQFIQFADESVIWLKRNLTTMILLKTICDNISAHSKIDLWRRLIVSLQKHDGTLYRLERQTWDEVLLYHRCNSRKYMRSDRIFIEIAPYQTFWSTKTEQQKLEGDMKICILYSLF